MSIRAIGDFGPIYQETLPGRFPVEPWNTYSNVIFLLIIAYFYSKTRLDSHTYPMMSVSIPILFLGFVGGTVFHATRSHSVWLIMDFVPILLLTALACYFFWKELLHRRGLAFGMLLLGLIVGHAIRSWLPFESGTRISAGYTIVAFNVIAPAALLCFRSKSVYDGLLLSGSALMFGVAVFFRQFDSHAPAQCFPMGTHFLWHLFGGLATFFLMELIFRLESRRVDDLAPRA